MVGASGSNQTANVTTGGLIFNAATNALSVTGNIISSGNVGINTTTPTVPLDVQGGTRTYGIANFDGATYFAQDFKVAGVHKGYLASASAVIGGGSANDVALDASAGNLILATGDSERARIDSSGLVGIGTSTPNASAQVTIKAASTGIYQLQLEQSNATDGYALRCSASDGDLSFTRYASSAFREDMRLQSTSGRHTGRLIIGATTNRSVESKLEVRGPANTPLSIYMFKDTQVEVNLGFGDSGDSNFYINSGSTTIGTSGVYLTNGGNSWNSVSDERMKTIVEPILDAVQKVMTLRAVIGSYKNDKNNARRPFLIAQDVQAVLPEAVNVQNEETGMLGMSYTDTIPLLVAAIKEQQAMITALTARVAELEKNL